MQFDSPLIEGRLILRYKRFLADVRLDDDRTITVHCPNTGAMLGCQAPGSRVWLSHSDDPRRKYPYTWEIVETAAGAKVGIHARRANDLVEEVLAEGRLAPLGGYAGWRREVAMGSAGSRVDFVLRGHASRPDCFLEVKSVTAVAAEGIALFPDAVSSRASRHLAELRARVEEGSRAAVFFCVQRDDVTSLRPATEIDPRYGEALAEAVEAGVELYAWRARVSTVGISLATPVAVGAGQRM